MRSPHAPLISFQTLLALAQSLSFPFVVTFLVKAGGYEGNAAVFYMLAFFTAILILPLAPRLLQRPYTSMCAAMILLSLFLLMSWGAIWMALPAAGFALVGASHFLRRCEN